MSRRHLSILVLVTATVAILAAITIRVSQPEQGSVVGERLYPELEARINDVVKIQSRTAGNELATIVLKDGAWRVADRNDYLANSTRLRQSLLILSRLELVEEKTSDPDKHPILGVQPVEEAEERTQQLKLFDANGMELANVIIGKLGTGSGHFVRRATEKTSWLSSGQIYLPANSAEWLVQDLFDISEERIRKVTVEPAEGQPYSIEKASAEEKQFKVVPLPEGMKGSVSNIGRLGRVFSRQKLNDVLSNAEADQNTTPWSKATAETFDGLILDAQARVVGEQYQLRVKARHEASDDASASEVAQEVQTINQRTDGWTYVMASYRAAPLLAMHAQLVEAEAIEEDD